MTMSYSWGMATIAEPTHTMKSLRLPTELAKRAEAFGHPYGFSALVRDALESYLATPSDEDVSEAMRVLSRVVSQRTTI